MDSSIFHDHLCFNLKNLTEYRIVDFALNVCRQLLPDYKHFHGRYNWGNFELLEFVLDKVEKRALITSEIKKLIIEIDEIIPDSEVFGDYSGSYAINASACILEMLEYLIDSNVKHIINISIYSTDTIDFKLHESNQSLNESDLINHPLLQNEQERQLNLTRTII